MSRGKYPSEFEAKIVLEVLPGERELGVIAVGNSLNPNMVRNWKSEFMKNTSRFLRSVGSRNSKQKEGRLLQI